MWMTREEIAKELGIVVNSVRGKVKKGQIERKVVDGQNMYRIVDPEAAYRRRPPSPRAMTTTPAPPSRSSEPPEPTSEPIKPVPTKSGSFNPRQVLLDLLSSIKVGRSIEAIEKGDEIDLATDEISRELDAKISMRQAKQVKEIEEALERIKHGDYGICEDCGETIPEQRLRLFPAARLCVRCQEDADRFEKMKEDSSLRGGAWRDDSSDGGFTKSFDD